MIQLSRFRRRNARRPCRALRSPRRSGITLRTNIWCSRHLGCSRVKTAAARIIFRLVFTALLRCAEVPRSPFEASQAMPEPRILCSASTVPGRYSCTFANHAPVKWPECGFSEKNVFERPFQTNPEGMKNDLWRAEQSSWKGHGRVNPKRLNSHDTDLLSPLMACGAPE